MYVHGCARHRSRFVRMLLKSNLDARYSHTLLRLAESIFTNLDDINEVIRKIVSHAAELVDCEGYVTTCESVGL